MEINQSIALTLDTIPPFYRLRMRQGDSARQIKAAIYEGTRAWTIPSDIVIEFRAQKPDGTKIMRNEGITYSENIVTIPVTSNTLAVPGEVTCELVFSDQAGDILGTVNFSIEVWPSIITDGELESQDDFQSLVQALAEAQQSAEAAKSSADAASSSASAAQLAATQADNTAQTIAQEVQKAETAAESATTSATQAAASAAEVAQTAGSIQSAVNEAQAAAKSASESAGQAEQNTAIARQTVEESASQVEMAQQSAQTASQSSVSASEKAESASQSASAAAQSAQQAAESVASIGNSVEQAAASAAQAAQSATAAAGSASAAAADAAEVLQKVDGFKGSFENLAALEEANPNPQDGDWAVAQDTRSIWVYNATLSLWEESGSSHNYLLNAGFLINQRGQSSYSSSGLGLDMWFNNFDTANMNMTLTTEAVEGQSERAVVISCNSVTGVNGGVPLFFQQIENVNGKSLVAGKKVTLSFYYKTEADYRTLFVAYKPAGSGDFAILQKPILASPDAYTQAYYTVEIPEGATNVQLGSGSSRVLTSGDNGTAIRITRPQVVEGNSPRRWEVADMSADLMKCQRFYERINNCWGNAVNGNLLWLSVPFKVEKANTPTLRYGFGDMPNVVQIHRTTGVENLPLMPGALTADTQGAYFNGNASDGGTAVTNANVWVCYVEAEAPLI